MIQFRSETFGWPIGLLNMGDWACLIGTYTPGNDSIVTVFSPASVALHGAKAGRAVKAVMSVKRVEGEGEEAASPEYLFRLGGKRYFCGGGRSTRPDVLDFVEEAFRQQTLDTIVQSRPALRCSAVAPVIRYYESVGWLCGGALAGSSVIYRGKRGGLHFQPALDDLGTGLFSVRALERTLKPEVHDLPLYNGFGRFICCVAADGRFYHTAALAKAQDERLHHLCELRPDGTVRAVLIRIGQDNERRRQITDIDVSADGTRLFCAVRVFSNEPKQGSCPVIAGELAPQHDHHYRCLTYLQVFQIDWDASETDPHGPVATYDWPAIWVSLAADETTVAVLGPSHEWWEAKEDTLTVFDLD